MKRATATALILALLGVATAAAGALLAPQGVAPPPPASDGPGSGDGGNAANATDPANATNRTPSTPPNRVASNGSGDGGLGDWSAEALLAADGGAPVADVRGNATHVEAVAREVELDEDDALLAMALANSGATVAVEDVISYTERRVEARTLDRFIAYERETVLSALALGLSGGEGIRDAAVAPGGVERVVVTVTEVEQRVDLDRDTVLLAIALAGDGGHASLEEVLSVNRTVTRETRVLQDVDISDEGAFLRLALGDGGGGAPGQKG